MPLNAIGIVRTIPSFLKSTSNATSRASKPLVSSEHNKPAKGLLKASGKLENGLAMRKETSSGETAKSKASLSISLNKSVSLGAEKGTSTRQSSANKKQPSKPLRNGSTMLTASKAEVYVYCINIQWNVVHLD